MYVTKEKNNGVCRFSDIMKCGNLYNFEMIGACVIEEWSFQLIKNECKLRFSIRMHTMYLSGKRNNMQQFIGKTNKLKY